MKMLESKVQSSCYQWYHNNYCLKHHNPRGLMFSIPNELGGSNKIQTMQMKAMGLTSGVSDTIVILPSGRLIFVEFKNSKGVQSANQKEFQKRVESLGYTYLIVRSLEQFKEIIEKD